MNSYRTVLCIVLILAIPTIGFGESDYADAKKHLADLFYAEFRNDVAEELKNTGLAPVEVENIVNSVMDGYASCVIDALPEDKSSFSKLFLSALEDGLSASELDEKLGDAESPEANDFLATLGESLDVCRITVDSELGLPPRE